MHRAVTQSRARPTRLGATMCVVAMVASACGIVGGGGGGGRTFTAYFTRAVSLFPDSQVRVLGLPAGSVADVEVEGNLVRVELSVSDDVPVPADAQATIVPFSLIGERYVQLFPAYTGGPRMKDGAVIPVERTSVPVEPDEALKSLRDLLEDLNPEGTRRLTENLAEDLEGQGQSVNAMLAQVGDLTRDLGAKSDSLGRIIDHFDAFTASLVTREAQIGRVLDDFAAVTGVLAEERAHLANVVTNLAKFAADARELVEKHGDSLGKDLEVLEHVAQALEANLAAVGQLLDTGPMLASGLRGAYNATNRVIMLRDRGALDGATQGPSASGSSSGAGAPGGGPGVGPAGGATGGGSSAPVPETPFGPLDELLRQLADQGDAPVPIAARAAPRRGRVERMADAGADFVRRVGGLARAVVGL